MMEQTRLIALFVVLHSAIATAAGNGINKPHIITILIDDLNFPNMRLRCVNGLESLKLKNKMVERTSSVENRNEKVSECKVSKTEGNSFGGTMRYKDGYRHILWGGKGWNDVGFHGSNQVSTPNIDALAYSGIILNRHYVLPTCTPSRASLLTGSYPIRTGLQGYPMKCGVRRGIPLSVKLKPEYLKNLGYHTHLVGKWHLGYYTPKHLPSRRGFDSFFGYHNGYIDYFNYGVGQEFSVNNISQTYYGYDLHRDEDIDWKWKGKYATRVFTNRARKIIKKHNKSEPLYLLLSHLGVHTGSVIGTGLEVPTDMNVDESYGYIKERPRRELVGLLQELDHSVSSIVQVLKENDMLNNSIILIMSDNGGHTVSTDMQPNWSSNWPLRGMKFTMFEGGVRGAALIWSPLLPKGVISEQFIHISDWLPTLYYAAGGNLSDLQDIDGINQWNALKDLRVEQRDHILLNIDEVEGDEGIILKNRWKVKKGGLKKYGNYDLHWGIEENKAPLPSHYYSKVRRSITGRILSNMTNYEEILKGKNMKILRRNSAIKCDLDNAMYSNQTREGYVNESEDFLCSDYCVFDIINDPCELKTVENEKILNKGKKLLKKFRKTLRPQEDNSVDPLSDPEKRGGSWVPWVHSTKLFYY